MIPVPARAASDVRPNQFRHTGITMEPSWALRVATFCENSEKFLKMVDFLVGHLNVVLAS